MFWYSRTDGFTLLVIKTFYLFFFLFIIFYVPGNWQLQWITHVMRIGLELNVIYKSTFTLIYMWCVYFFQSCRNFHCVYVIYTYVNKSRIY